MTPYICTAWLVLNMCWLVYIVQSACSSWSVVSICTAWLVLNMCWLVDVVFVPPGKYCVQYICTGWWVLCMGCLYVCWQLGIVSVLCSWWVLCTVYSMFWLLGFSVCSYSMYWHQSLGTCTLYTVQYCTVQYSTVYWFNNIRQIYILFSGSCITVQYMSWLLCAVYVMTVRSCIVHMPWLLGPAYMSWLLGPV